MLTSVLNPEDIRKARQRLSHRSFDVSLLKALVFDGEKLTGFSADSCVKSYIKSRILTYEGPKKIYQVQDQDFKACLINEANLQFSKALYNWSIYKQLVSKGLWSWAFVSLYYSQFYSINGLLNVQGNAFSRPILLTEDGKEKQVLFHIYTEDFAKGKFYFEMRDYSPHEDLWRQYYAVYRDYRFRIKEFSQLYEYDRVNPLKAMKLRHYVNYDVSFIINDFIEYSWPLDELENFALRMQQDTFLLLINEDEYSEMEYTSSLRIKLLFDILHGILDNLNLRSFREKIYLSRTEMLSKIKDSTCVSKYFSDWIRTAS